MGKIRSEGNLKGRILLKGVLIVTALLLLSGCAASRPVLSPTSSGPQKETGAPVMEREVLHLPLPDLAPSPYRIGPGDVLQVRDLDHPDLFSTTPNTIDPHRFEVMEDGSVQLPMVGTVQAAGRTVIELQKSLEQEYGAFVRAPNVSVTVAEYRSQRFFVLGEVARPGAYPFDGRATLLDALGIAGGTTATSDLRSSHLVRGSEVLPLDFEALIRDGDLRYNVPLRGGDVLTVRSLADRKVYVLGEVRRPGVYPMSVGDMKLVDAISLAGGLDPVTAHKGNVLLVRGDYANPVITRISLKDVLDITRIETVLEPGDRIFAMPTGLTNWNRAIVQLLPFLQAGQSASDMRKDFVE